MTRIGSSPCPRLRARPEFGDALPRRLDTVLAEPSLRLALHEKKAREERRQARRLAGDRNHRDIMWPAPALKSFVQSVSNRERHPLDDEFFILSRIRAAGSVLGRLGELAIPSQVVDEDGQRRLIQPLYVSGAVGRGSRILGQESDGARAFTPNGGQ